MSFQIFTGNFAIQFLVRTLTIVTILGYASTSIAETRYALVVGNGNYNSAPLSSPTFDADAMALKLQELGYDVTIRKNLTNDLFYHEIKAFGARLRANKAPGLFYYSGHGNQINGRNYLIPVDADIRDEEDIEHRFGIRVDFIVATMEMADSRPNVVVLDACRNNPFEKNFKDGAAGMTNMTPAAGMLIAFAAAPGRTAIQVPNDLSIYTRELVKRIGEVRESGISVQELFGDVANAVFETTHGKQQPHMETAPGIPKTFILRRIVSPEVVQLQESQKLSNAPCNVANPPLVPCFFKESK